MKDFKQLIILHRIVRKAEQMWNVYVRDKERERENMFLFSVQATEPQHCDVFRETQH